MKGVGANLRGASPVGRGEGKLSGAAAMSDTGRVGDGTRRGGRRGRSDDKTG